MFYTIIADDLTGACDTGVTFARRGWSVRVAFTPEADFSGAVVRVVTTESRGMGEAAAARAVEQAVQAMGISAADRIYKKIDSTVRGQPGAELAAVMHSAGIRRALVTPAFPAQGRVVRGGRVFVHGAPLEETTFGQDVTQPDPQHLFGAHAACRVVGLETIRQGVERVVEILTVEHLKDDGPVVIVADAETGADLRILAEAAERADIRLLCGSAGLAGALVETLPKGEGLPPLAFRPLGRPVLTIAGSHSPVTLRQVEAARAAAVAVVCSTPKNMRIANNVNQLPEDSLPKTKKASRCQVGGQLGRQAGRQLGPAQADTEITSASRAITHHLSRSEHVILCVTGLERIPGMEQQIAAQLARITGGVLSQAQVGGLVLTGGETAAAVCRELGCTAIDLGGEVQPGVVWGRLAGGRFSGMPVVTKAGGFGGEGTLLEAIRFLT